MRISWRNLFWKQLTSLISEIDAFSLSALARLRSPSISLVMRRASCNTFCMAWRYCASVRSFCKAKSSSAIRAANGVLISWDTLLTNIFCALNEISSRSSKSLKAKLSSPSSSFSFLTGNRRSIWEAVIFSTSLTISRIGFKEARTRK